MGNIYPALMTEAPFDVPHKEGIMNDPSMAHMARQLTAPSCDQLTQELCLSALCKINTAAGRFLITGEECYTNIIPKVQRGRGE